MAAIPAPHDEWTPRRESGVVFVGPDLVGTAAFPELRASSEMAFDSSGDQGTGHPISMLRSWAAPVRFAESMKSRAASLVSLSPTNSGVVPWRVPPRPVTNKLEYHSQIVGWNVARCHARLQLGISISA
jgi:hypothetical protein